jgi:hypothetical protein
MLLFYYTGALVTISVNSADLQVGLGCAMPMELATLEFPAPELIIKSNTPPLAGFQYRHVTTHPFPLYRSL